MLARIGIAALFAFASLSAAPAVSAEPSGLRLDRVVMLMRHGIRPPTKAEPVPAGYSDKPWPKWGVDPGLLTERGAVGVGLLGDGDRSYFVARGLLPATGCPARGAVKAMASAKQRSIRTAESYVARLLPGCGITVVHPPIDGDDPIFHGLDGAPAAFDGHVAWLAAMKNAPPGGLASEARAYRAELDLLQRALGCCAPPACAKAKHEAGCALRDMPTTLVENRNDRPDLEGPLDVGSTASQSFLLEYLEGMPMSDVAWGRLSRADIEKLLVFHPVKFKYSNRPDYISDRAAAAIAQAMLDAIVDRGPNRLTLLAGHDTNIADLGSLFDVHWKVASYPADDVPPGGALGFEVLRDAHGARFVKAFFRAQTMDQLRNQVALGSNAQPERTYLKVPGCPTVACPVAVFTKVARSHIVPIEGLGKPGNE